MLRMARALSLLLPPMALVSAACGGGDPGTGGAGGTSTTSSSATTSGSTTTSSTDSTTTSTSTSSSTTSTSTSSTGTGTGGTGGTGTGTGTGGAGVCGDGVPNAGELCDDGNTAAGDGCSPTCAFEATCGNDLIEPGESCDDGNTTAGDGCSATCQLEAGSVCGNAVNLNDPTKVTVTGRVTDYQGTTLGSTNTTFGAPSCSAGTTDVPRVVHRYRVGGEPAVLHVEMLDAQGPLLDGVLWAYRDCQSPITELACGEDTPSSLLGAIDTGWLPAGTTVFLVAAGYSDLDVGPYRLRITETPATLSTKSGTCAVPTPAGPGTYAGATLVTDAHGGGAATACPADAPDAVYAVELAKPSDLVVSATTNSGDYDVVVSLSKMPCGTGPEVACADAHGTGAGESLSATDLAAGTYYVIVGGYSAADVGPYALHIDVVDILAAGAACDPANAAQRCATGTLCHAGTCATPTTLLFADFSVNLAPFSVVDAGPDGETWMHCDPVSGCAWDNTTGESVTDPYALVRDTPGVALDGEELVSLPLNAFTLGQVFVAFDHAFEHAASSADLGVVEIAVNGAAFVPVASYTADASGRVTLDISAMAAGKSGVQLRFRYDDQTDAAADPFANGWSVDNVHVYGF